MSKSSVSTPRRIQTTAPSRTRPDSSRSVNEPTRRAPMFDSTVQMLAGALLCAVMVLAPYELSGFWPVSDDYFPQAVFLALTAAACLLSALSATGKFAASPLSIVLILFLAWNVATIATAVYRHDAWLEIGRLGAALSWFWIARALLHNDRSGARATLLLLAISCGTLIVCVVAIVSFLQDGMRARQFSTFYNPNLFANFVAMSLPLIVAATLMARRFGAPRAAFILGAIVFVIGCGGLMVSGSKGGLLAALIGLLVWGVAVWRARGETARRVLRQHRRTVAIGAIVFTLMAGGLFVKTILPRLQSARTTDNNSTIFRVYTWKSTLQMANARPILGWGAGNFPSAYSQFAVAGNTGSAHQSWLQIAAESGWPSLLILIGAMIISVRSGWRGLRGARWPIAAGGLGALAALFVHGCTDAGWGILSIALLFAVVLALLDASNETDSDEAMVESNRRLDWRFLGLSLPLALLSSQALAAQTAENARAESEQLLRAEQSSRSDVETAFRKAKAATESDPSSASVWTQYGSVAQAIALPDDALAALNRAIALQPTLSANWRRRARFHSQRAGESKQAEADFNRAVALSPNDSYQLLARAQWLETFDAARAASDYERIAKLADEPFGRYPALAGLINFDFARAYLKLAARDIERGQYQSARTWIARGLSDIQRSHAAEKADPQMYAALKEAGQTADLRERKELQSAFTALNARLNDSAQK